LRYGPHSVVTRAMGNASAHSFSLLRKKQARKKGLPI